MYLLLLVLQKTFSDLHNVSVVKEAIILILYSIIAPNSFYLSPLFSFDPHNNPNEKRSL